MKKIFQRFSAIVSAATGTPIAFSLALLVVVIWALTGKVFSYSDTWQLVINTGTTIVTFLMVFLIQNTQNRDGKAVQLKLDELIHASTKARDSLVSLESMTDEDLAALDEEFHKIHDKHEPSPVLHKLHATISAEHKRRHMLREIITAPAKLPGKLVDKHNHNMQK